LLHQEHIAPNYYNRSLRSLKAEINSREIIFRALSRRHSSAAQRLQNLSRFAGSQRITYQLANIKFTTCLHNTVGLESGTPLAISVKKIVKVIFIVALQFGYSYITNASSAE